MPLSPNVQGTTKLKISNAVKLNAESPIPFEYGGIAFSALNGAKYLPFFAPDDRFFQTLLEARLLSVTQNACIHTKRNYCLGSGWTINNLATSKKIDPLFEAWAACINNKNETLNNIFTKAFGSHFCFGNTPVEIVRGTAGGKRFIKIYVRSPLECRLSLPNTEDSCEQVIISKHFKEKGIWYGLGKGSSGAITIPIYNALNKKNSWLKDGSVERTMLWIKNEMDGYSYYGLPSSISGLSQQVLEYEITRYNLDNLDNNMKPGGVILLQGNVTQEEANRLGKSIIHQHSGKGKRGRWIVMASEQGIESSKVEQLSVQQEGSFNELDHSATEKILFANEWDSVLAGLQHSSSNAMGKGNSYFLSVFKAKYNTVIKPAQEFILEQMLKPILSIYDEWMNTKWSSYNFSLQTNIPITAIDGTDSIDGMTVNEVRSAVGLPPLEDKQKGNMLLIELRKSGGTNV